MRFAVPSTLLLACLVQTVVSQTTASSPAGTLQAHHQRLLKRQTTADGAAGGGNTAAQSSAAVSVSVSAPSSSVAETSSEPANTESRTADQQSTSASDNTPSTTSAAPSSSSAAPESTSQSSAASTDASSTGVQSTNSASSSSNAASTTDASSSGASTAASGTSTGAASSGSATAGVSTVIVTQTAADGELVTSQSLSTDASQQTDTTNQGASQEEPSNSKKWIIPLSVTGGIILFAGLLFVGYRFTQRRFSDLDDESSHAIRWPELLRRNDEDNQSSFNVLGGGTTRKEGYEMDDAKSSYGGSTVHQARDYDLAAAGLAAPGVNMSRSASSVGSAVGSNVGPGIGGGPYYAGPQQGYYDPYLGASSAPFPPPPRTMSPQPGSAYYGSGGYPSDMYPAGPGSPNPYYPPVPPGAGQFILPARSTSPYLDPRAASPALRPASANMSQVYPQEASYGVAPPPVQMPNEQEEMKSLSPPLSPTQSVGGAAPAQNAQKRQSQGMTLSLANPTKEEE